MANIKFSQFTVGNTESDIDFVVGYKGGDNIQISPANLLSATLTGYLPLTGGTMTGDIVFNDNEKARFGTGLDAYIQHDSSNTEIINATGNLNIKNNATNGDITFFGDNGSGGVATYFSIDGGAQLNRFSKNVMWNDSVVAYFGGGFDLQISHDGIDSYIQNATGNLKIFQNANDKDITFYNDDGSGGTTAYFFLDGSAASGGYKYTVFPDQSTLSFGNSLDFNIFHFSNTFVNNETGDLYITNSANDKDVIFRSDDGAGGVTTYFRVDGGDENVRFSKDAKFSDSVKAVFGGSNDLQIFHDGSNSYVQAEGTGDLVIEQKTDDKDILFKSDDGSGGVTTYFYLDGSLTLNRFLTHTLYNDNIEARFGTQSDLTIYHDGTTSYIKNAVGNLNIRQNADDADISFQCDDGSGGLTEYFRLDGSSSLTIFTKNLRMIDTAQIQLGGGSDLRLRHNGTDSYIENFNGDFYIDQNTADKDIVFRNDNGSGGVTTYFFLDGSLELNRFLKSTLYNDNIRASFGASSDLQIYHDGTHSYLSNNTGNLYIQQLTDDSDIVFQSDDGAGGVTTYMFLDGSTTLVQFYKSTKHSDNIKANFGSSNDLQIYHDGSNSFITENNTGGSLIIRGSNFAVQSSDGTDDFITTVANQGVKLFYNDVEKLETTSTGIKISGVSEYADNTAAIAGGLTTGDVYRTGDLLKIVH